MKLDTNHPEYYEPKNFKFGKNGSNTFTIRKGDFLKKYIKENLPDNGSHRFVYFYKTDISTMYMIKSALLKLSLLLFIPICSISFSVSLIPAVSVSNMLGYTPTIPRSNIIFLSKKW